MRALDNILNPNFFNTYYIKIKDNTLNDPINVIIWIYIDRTIFVNIISCYLVEPGMLCIELKSNLYLCTILILPIFLF